MKNTALTHIHEGLGKMLLRLHHEINTEHETVRTAGRCDVSHMGEFYLQVLMHWL
jgi:glycine cleavage system aminomethyltransferase T